MPLTYLKHALVFIELDSIIHYSNKIGLLFKKNSLSKALYLLIFFLNTFHLVQSFTIMIDPIGDTKNTGQEIEDTFERVLTLQCAQKLKEMIMHHQNDIQVIITRTAGETLQYLQNASFANRMNVDLYLALSFYHQPSAPNYVFIFYYRQDIMTPHYTYDQYFFYHISQAYLMNQTISQNIAKMFAQIFQNKNYNNYCIPIGPFGIPCMPLFGIKSPAIYLEAGLKNKNDWVHLLEPIVATITAIMP